MKIPDFTETELSVVRETVAERFRKPVEIQVGDAEIRLDPSDRELTVVPAAVWNEGGANFVIFKAGDGDFRAQFFYRVHKQYGTGQRSYDNIGDCVVTLLQVQSDHDRNEATAPPVDPGPVAKPGEPDSDSDSTLQYWGD
jgi:hypothetical protein